MQEIAPDHSIIDIKKDHIINKVYVTSNSRDVYEDDSKTSKFHYYLNIVLKVASLLWISITLYYMYKIASFDYNSIFHPENTQKNEFVHYTASQFKNYEYFGREELFRKMISKMTKIIDMTENMSEKELNESLTTNKRNFLLHGPPGTGKTQFIKVLVKRLNDNLCKKYRTTKDLVRAYFITPSMLEDKYVGETERKIKALFDEARNDEEWKATFIFIDEIDAFFGHRTSTLGEHQTKSKTEFLNLLSGINDDLKKNIFVMGATNRPNEIDPAFKRRMGESISFNFPNREELIDMLTTITKSWKKSGNYVECIEFVADMLKDRYSQSVVTDICSEVVFKYGKGYDNLYEKLKEFTKSYLKKLTDYNDDYDSEFFYN